LHEKAFANGGNHFKLYCRAFGNLERARENGGDHYNLHRGSNLEGTRGSVTG
jgi:hypothetical protein